MNDPEISMLAQKVLTLFKTHDLMVTTAESCTGGMIGAAITDIAGSSSVYERGFITYSNEAKKQMLGVSQTSLDTHGAVSEMVAAEMAVGAVRNSAAHVAVSVTGIAGPGGSDHKPEGRVCFGIAMDGRDPVTETVDFGALGRAIVRRAATLHALSLLVKTIDG